MTSDLRQGGQGRPIAGGPMQLGGARSLHRGGEGEPGAYPLLGLIVIYGDLW